MFSHHGEHVQGRDARGFATLFDVVLPSEPADELGFMADDRENTAEIKQVARLNTLGIRPNGRPRGRQRDVEVGEPALCGRWLRVVRAYHLPECAPPSTCSTSPVT